MQEGERDVLEVLIFGEIEETVGTWLRAIIQRLEKRADSYSKGSPQAANPKRRIAQRNAPLPEALSEVCKINVFY